MRHLHLIFLWTLLVITGCSAADIPKTDSPAGAWRFEKSVDYLGEEIIPHKYDTIQIVDRRLILSPQCSVALERRDYTFAGTFQLLLKDGVTIDKFNKFIKKNFSVDMATVRDVYVAGRLECSEPFTEILVSKDRLIVTHASTLFYSFVRVKPPAPPAGNTPALSQKLTPVPFSVASYRSGCNVPVVKEIPQTTTKCGPLYYPYVATKADADGLAKLIGSHNYAIDNMKSKIDYNNPVKHGLHPVFLVFPPMGDVILVRVEDFESGEDRDPMSGVYLAIKGGKVTDQLGASCNITTKYVCVGDEGKEMSRLLSNGTFSVKDFSR